MTMSNQPSGRYCSCGARLARDNPDTRCAPCEQKAREERLHPPDVPPEFWETEQLRDAFASWHMGRICCAYRHHPFHGPRPLPQERVAGWFGMTQAKLSCFENGEPTRNLDKLIRWAQVLGIPARYLWFDLPGRSRNGNGHRSPDESNKLDVDALIAGTRPLDGEYVIAVREAIRQLLALGSQFGGDDVSGLATRFFWSVHYRLWSETYDPKIERDLRAAAGELGEVAGWFLYDANKQATARQLNHEALLLSRLAGDRKMEWLTLQNMSMQAGYLNRPREALTFARAVLSSGRLSTRVNALFHVREARALAQSEEGSDALQGFAHARTLFLDGVADDDPPWVYWVDESEFAWHEAMCHADLDNWGRAVELFHQSFEGRPLGRPGARFNDLGYLLKALVEVEAWRDVEITIEKALPYVGEVGSARTAVLLQGVATRIDAMKASPSLHDAAHHLRDRLNAAGGVRLEVGGGW